MSDTNETDTPKTATASAPKDEEVSKALRKLVDKRLALSAVRSEGTAVIGAGAKPAKLAYDVTAAYVPVMSNAFDREPGEPQAAVFTIAYAAKAGKTPDAASRPVLFSFNGGPGSSSVWLHLGALGPKRVKVNDDGTMPPPPYAVVDNEHTWFEHFDLVFIDPPYGAALHGPALAAVSKSARWCVDSPSAQALATNAGFRSTASRCSNGWSRRWDRPFRPDAC